MFEKITQKLSSLKRITWNSLRFKIIFFSSLMLLFTVLISASLMHTMGSTILRDQIFFDLSAVAKSKSDQVVSIIEQDFERVALVASRTQLRRNLLDFDSAAGIHSSEESREGMIKILQDARNSVPALKDIEIINLEGTVIACTDAANIGREEKDQDWFQQGLQGQYQSSFNEENGHFTYILALPLIHPETGNENAIGVVKIVLSLDRMMAVLNDRTGLRNTGEIILVARIENQYVAMNSFRHQPGAALTVLNIGLIQAMRNATRGDSGFLQEIDYRGVDTLTAFSHVPVEMKDWGLIVKIDAAEAFAPMRALQRILILVAGIIWILGSIALSANVTRATAPVKKLLSGTRKLGEGDLEYRVHVTSQDELGVLTSAFNNMAENLQKITASRNELELEVAERLKMEGKLKEAKEAAEAANKTKSEFLANMSHEIRTPLNGVIGFTDLLNGTPLSPVQQQYVNNANVSGHTLLGIINDILNFSKIEAGMLHLEMIKTDMVELLENSVDIVKFAAGNKNLEMLLHIDPSMPRFAVTDPIRLKQILANLLGNAVKFTEKGEVELKVAYESLADGRGKLAFSVRDTGIGISEAQKEKLFKAFSQADSSTTRKFGGTGLGLIISDLIAQKLGSKIQIDSKQGEGSTFYFDIVTDTEEGEKLDKGSIEKIKRCLIIDDNANNRLILEELLANWDIAYESCSDGLTALKLLDTSKPFDIIICDYNMPYIDGLETIRMIHEKLKLSPEKQPIILLHSSSDDAELHKQCEELGVRFRLTKPVKSNDLHSYLCQVHAPEQKENEPTISADSEVQVSSFQSNDIKILIAEDVAMNMIVIKAMLNKILSGAELIEAASGLGVLEQIKKTQPDLIFMDVQMPEMDGIEATREIRRIEQGTGKHIPIVALTAGAFNEEQEKCLAAGMDDFLAKPVEAGKVKAALDKYLVKKQSNQDTVHFSKEALLAQTGSDDDLVKELIAIALTDFPDRLKNLGALIEEGNNNDIGELAHQIKGAALNMGCSTFAEIAAEMEKMSITEENLPLRQEMFKALQAEWAIVKKLMEE